MNNDFIKEAIIKMHYKNICGTGDFPTVGEPTIKCENCSFNNVACSPDVESGVVGCYSGWNFD